MRGPKKNAADQTLLGKSGQLRGRHGDARATSGMTSRPPKLTVNVFVFLYCRPGLFHDSIAVAIIAQAATSVLNPMATYILALPSTYMGKNTAN